MEFSFNFTIDADMERKIVLSKIYGIWRKETAEQYREEFAKVVQPLLKEKWAKLINLTNWKTSYPDMIEEIGDHITWSHENNAVYSVYVVDNPITRNQLKKMITHSESPDACKIFKTMAEGDAFLKAHGF